MREINKIIIHCSATPAGRSVTVADIDRWHRERGFDCIGYHYVVYLDGSVCEGRPVERIGAHCKGQNANSVGVCYIGGTRADGTPYDTRTDEQRTALRDVVRSLCRRYGIPSGHVYGHGEFARKACPCFNVKKEFRSHDK